MITLIGKEVTAKMKMQVEEMVASMNGYVPTAAIIRIGERPDDLSYEKNAIKKMTAVGMNCEVYAFPEDIAEEDFKKAFMEINNNDAIDGILMFRPLPKHINEKWFEYAIDPAKDLDGINPINTAKVFSGETDGFAPCTAEAVIEVLKSYQIPIEGKRVVIVGRSMVVGRPVSMLFLKENATVTVCHTKTKNLKEICREAEILVAAAGVAKMLNQDYVADGAVVIDVGINIHEDGQLCGDVEWEGLETVASAATPVPGGVGAVTTTMLCRHLAEAAMRKLQK
ncbi:MAG: bifunctional 5,10-methylene-tetrahydrofolate dehydrogenase/5,10-methylene-tetrahydrofolate cyclohydrolase [Lachnospiraceae bacterium]|nr:bifunctional 5,10-methylene-tetrahydrofolate dehydrogenase/5,10-methylene-tetrahydrofolate cyclohydrolase [Lachnospiraceae bacterium]